MKAKDFLNQLKKLDKLITNKLIEIEQWKEIACATASQSMDTDRVQTSGASDKIGNAVSIYTDIQAEINKTIDELIDKKKDVISVLEQLNATEYDLMHKIYVQYLTFNEVANTSENSYSWVTTTHGRALKSVQRILDEREKKEGKG